MQEAVNQSYALADKQDVVLLSPACASFDLFRIMKIEVYNLKNKFVIFK